MKFKEIKISEKDIERFNGKIDRTSSCHVWTGKPDKDGYGTILCNKKIYRSHRVAYFLSIGYMDTSLVIDHLCKNRMCCNPDHLRAVDQKINASENTDAIKTHCIHGHEFTDENTYYNKDGKYGHKKCKTCHSKREKNYREKRKHARASESSEKSSIDIIL